MRFPFPRKGGWKAVLATIVALVLWYADQQQESPRLRIPSTARREAAQAAKEGKYQKYEGCKLVDHRQNDGDSFRVRLPDGEIHEFRLYFVDCPESSFRTYRGGATNHERIAEQGKYFGISAEAAATLGAQAKSWTLKRLGSKPFTVFTAWHDPFGDSRFHAIIQTGDGTWLHQGLVREGMARIHTKPGVMPDGTPANVEVARLRNLEKQAKASRRGGWKK